MKTNTFYVLRQHGMYASTNEDTLINLGEFTLADARRFLTLGALLDWAQRRGQKHAAASLLSDYQVVRVEETVTEQAATTVVVPGAEKQDGDVFAIRTNSTYFFGAEGCHRWTTRPFEARTFVTEGAALRFAMSGELPDRNGIHSLQFVALRKVPAKPVIKVTETVL